jgi:hypothetical protein
LDIMEYVIEVVVSLLVASDSWVKHLAFNNDHVKVLMDLAWLEGKWYNGRRIPSHSIIAR